MKVSLGREGAGRVLTLSGCHNCRDLGGYPCGDRRVKWGLIFRSDSLHALTEADRACLEGLGIKRVIDFRGAGERAKQPDILPAGAAYEALDPAADLARKAGEAQDKNGDEQKIARLLAAAASEEGRVSLQKNGMADQMRYLVTDSAAVKAYEVFFRRLEEDGSLPILFHCRGGKDRTGWAAALLLLLLGADRDCVKEDYLLTGELNRERNLRRMEEYRRYTSDPLVLDYLAGLQDARESYIDAAFAELDRVSAGPEDYVLRYFNLGPERVDALRSRFLEY